MGKIGKKNYFLSIDNVFYVESLRHNLLSISQYVTMDIMSLFSQKVEQSLQD